MAARLLAVGLVVAACLATAVVAATGPAWNYAQTDAQWAALRATDTTYPYAACVGPRQSPVDLAGVVADSGLQPLAPAWAPFATFTVTNNGHTVQVDQTSITAPSFRDPNTGTTYSLLQFHFHSPSEHTWSGAYRDMEVHLVHKASDGNLLVIGVSFVASPYGTNTFLNQFWTNIIGLAKDGRAPRSVPLNFTDVVPVNPTYTTYPGSLTTPPCSPIVTWYVMDEAIPVSVDQLEQIRTTLGFVPNNKFTFTVDGNARRVQPLLGRTLRRYVETGTLPTYDKDDMATGPGRVSVAAIVLAVFGFVMAAIALTLFALPMLQKGQGAPVGKAVELRDKEKLAGAQV